MKNDKKQSARVNYVWVLAGGYLWYLTFQLLKILWRGETSNLLLSLVSIVAFFLVGAFLFRREWKAYQYGKQHIDDPETWGEESLPEETEEHHGD